MLLFQLRNDDKDFHDQGFTKPKILILLPTRRFCYEFINTLISIIENISEEQKVFLVEIR